MSEPRTRTKYAYDPDGNRVQKTTATGGSGGDPNGTWQFLYDQSGRMIQRFNGTLWQGNIYVGGRHLVEDGGGTNFSHADWLGTERMRSTNTGTVCESIASLPFGDGQTTTGACYHSSPLHFTGKEHDFESGLDYFGARFNSSSMGRFMSPDPANAGASLDSPQSWNAYSYVLNNPLTYIDPSGLVCVWADGSYDAADDPNTGSKAQCENAYNGGAWIDDNMGGGWSDQSDSVTALTYQNEMDRLDGADVFTLHKDAWGAREIDTSPSADAMMLAIHNAFGKVPTVCGNVGMFASAEIFGFGGFAQVDKELKPSAEFLVPAWVTATGGPSKHAAITGDGQPMLFIGEGAGVLYEPDLTNKGKPGVLGGYLGYSIPGTKTEGALGVYVSKPSIAGTYSCPQQ